MNYVNASDDVVVVHDLFRKDLGVVVRFSPGEVLDLESLCGEERVTRSEELKKLLDAGIVQKTDQPPSTRYFADAEIVEKGEVEFDELEELLESDKEGLDMENIRAQARPYPFGLSISLSYKDGSFRSAIECVDCEEVVRLTPKGFVCPTCSRTWDPVDVGLAISRLEAQLYVLKQNIRLWEKTVRECGDV